MKKLFLILLAIATIVACEKGPNVSYPLSKEDAKLVAKKYFDKYECLISSDIVRASTVLPQKWDENGNVIESFTTPDFDAWMLMMDTMPGINDAFNERTLLVFINVNNGKIKEYRASLWFNPGNIEFDRTIITTSEYNPKSFSPIQKSTEVLPRSDHKWAVIISGGAIPYKNYKRYWNDCSDIYITLTQNCGFAKNNIFCLISDGTDPAADQCVGYQQYENSSLDLDGDGQNEVQYSATKANISTVFNLLQSSVQSGDELFIFVTDHGNTDGSICLWGYNASISVSEFCAEVNKIPSSVRINILMGQCYSGVFTDALSASNRTIATASRASETSTGMGMRYDYFLFYWTEAIKTLKGDSNGDGRVSIEEAFQYANRQVLAEPNCSEHPQYKSIPTDLGSRYDLAGAYIYDSPTINGINVLSTGQVDCFTVSGLPSQASITGWSGTNVQVQQVTGNSAYLYGDYDDVYTDNGSITVNYSVNGFSYKKTRYNLQVWNPGTYFGDSYIHGNGNCYSIQEYPGAYGYEWMCNNSEYEIMIQGQSFVDLGIQPHAEDCELSVVFNNPRGERIIFERTISAPNY